ncbi:hypothetical protein BJX61DRAFT_552956 [Aspergillus egyptiacus]|nr:hypothetical protein BJX61DRAFT_552956 [Aspergillus egyptiacus]
MAEQDIYGGRLATGSAPLEAAAQHLPHTSGAEQDLYGQHFNSVVDRAKERIHQHTQHIPNARNAGTGAEQDLYGQHFSPAPSVGTVGLLQSTVLPSFTFHTAFSAIAYGIARYTDRAEGKDWLWPTGMTANAWWSAVGTRVVYDGLSLPAAWSSLSYSEKLLLGGVTAWGVRLFQRIASRSVQRGKDDPRYDDLKKEPGFWNKALHTMFLPEAVAQTFISLPFVLPFRETGESMIASPVTSSGHIYHSLAVFLFSTGFALEVLADHRLASHKKSQSTGLCRDGVWSIVRHPNYLGDALIHASFPVLLLGAGLFHPLAALGPIVNYVFLRFIGGDRQNEQSQEERYTKDEPRKAAEFQQYREEKNSFWPNARELCNKWSWTVLLAGAGGVLLEQGVRSVFA